MIKHAKLPTFQALCDKDEEFLWIGAPVRGEFIRSGVRMVIAGTAWAVIQLFLDLPRWIEWARIGGGWSAFGIGTLTLRLLPLWIALFNLVRLHLVVDNTLYALTNRRLMLRSGFWGTDFKAIDFDDITLATVRMSGSDEPLDVGSINVFSGAVASDGNPVVDRLVAVAHPREVLKRMEDAGVNVKQAPAFGSYLRPSTRGLLRSRTSPESR